MSTGYAIGGGDNGTVVVPRLQTSNKEFEHAMLDNKVKCAHFTWDLGIYQASPEMNGVGYADRVRRLVSAVRTIDHDFPYGVEEDAPDKIVTHVRVCGNCKGLFWLNPSLTVADLMALANRFGLRIISMKICDHDDCFKVWKVRHGADRLGYALE